MQEKRARCQKEDMKKFGLIGHPIAHSLSPALFKAGYEGRYPYDLIETDDFEDAYGRFLKDYDGINVTAPFKELVVRKADILSEECRQIGAANILVKTPEGIKAHNSDYLGVRQWLSEVAESVYIRPTILIVGLGGAGKAAAAAAHNLGYDLILMNRDISKAEVMAARLSDQADGINIIEVHPLTDFTKCFRKANIIIYNIPTAITQLSGLTDDDFRGTKVLLEANYKNPSFDKNITDRMLEVNPNSRYVSGETWLLYQALTGYEIFTGEKTDPVKMSEVISVSL